MLLHLRLSVFLILLVFSCPVFSQVTDFTPKTIAAGNGSVLTIMGSGFGSTRGPGAYVVFGGFHPIKVLETDYVFWSNTEIRVKVPLGAIGNFTVVVNPSVSYNASNVNIFHLATSDAYSPTHISAGTESVLTITGSGFGPNKTANNAVEFLGANAHQSTIKAATSDFVSWSDTKIEVKIPSGVGDGPIYITLDNGTMKIIHPWLKIDFNVHKENGLETKLYNQNGSGGYTFHLHSKLNSNNKAKAAFLRAFETWKCATGVNWTIGEPTSSTTGRNVIRILEDGEADVGAPGKANVSYVNIGGVWYVDNISITFSNYLDHYFKFSPNDAGLYDFESVALHTLGKAHNLGVVISDNDVMYWARPVTETEKRSLSSNDLSAGNFIMNLSKTSSGSVPAMLPLSTGACNTTYSYINSFSPASAKGGETVTITGTDFTGITSVKFGNIAASSFNVVSPTTITAVVGIEGASGDITVTGAGGVAAAAGFIFINRLPQTLNTISIPAKTYGDADFDLGVTASSGLPIIYSTNNSTIATIVNNKVHIISPGSVTITASQAGNSVYAPASININLIINKLDQNISFSSIPSKLITDPDFDLNASTSSGLALTYLNSNPAVATITNGRVHIISTGLTTITAVQSGNAIYNAAASISVNLMVSRLSQTINFPNIGSKDLNSADFEGGAVVSSGLPIIYSSSNTGVATIIDNKIHIVGAGTTIITATQAGDENYGGVSASVNLIVNKLQQTISLGQIANKNYNDPDFELNATISSGLPITYSSSNTNVVTIINNKVHIVGAGTATITATQSGNDRYIAVNTSVDLTVNKLQQTINFPYIDLKNHNDADFDLNATASSGLPVTYTSNNTAVANIIGNRVHIVAAGTAIITASQAGNLNINAAVDVSQNLNVVFNIPVSNFTIKSTDETCKTSDNGAINIIATQTLSYTATVTGNNKTTTYPFNSVLAINNLPAGIYNVCITVAGQANYKQCFDITIKEPKDLAVYSTLKNDGNTLILKLEGSDFYKIELNGQLITTTDQEITIPLIKGNNLIKISSNKTCQGVIEKVFLSTSGISLYPNPIKDVLNISTGNTDSSPVKIDIHALDGRLMHSSQQLATYSRISVDLSKLSKGLYVLTLSIGNTKTVHKIIKD